MEARTMLLSQQRVCRGVQQFRHGGTPAAMSTLASMSGIAGYLNLGTGLSGSVVVPPPSGAGYAPQPVNFSSALGGVMLNGISCTFGPVTAPWGTLTAFNVTDSSGNPYFAGTLQAPFTPLVGQLVTVPQGNISLAVGSQFSAGPSPASVPSLSYAEPSSGFVGSGSAVLVASGTYSRTFTVQTLPNSTTNVWLRPDGSTAVPNTGCLVQAGGGAYTFGTNAAPLPTANVTAVSDNSGGQAVLISGG
jgi:hypothetical protein